MSYALAPKSQVWNSEKSTCMLVLLHVEEGLTKSAQRSAFYISTAFVQGKHCEECRSIVYIFSTFSHGGFLFVTSCVALLSFSRPNGLYAVPFLYFPFRDTAFSRAHHTVHIALLKNRVSTSSTSHHGRPITSREGSSFSQAQDQCLHSWPRGSTGVLRASSPLISMALPAVEHGPSRCAPVFSDPSGTRPSTVD